MNKMEVSVSMFVFTVVALTAYAGESLPPLSGAPFNGRVPQTLEEAWAGYDPTVEPVEAEVLKEWEEQGVTLRVVRYAIGTFKGQKSIMVGLYGFPTGGKDLPGLVHVHGGGQCAAYNYVLNSALNGYAVISINWGGDTFSIGTQGKWEQPNTEWRGAVADQKAHNSHWDGRSSVSPDEMTIDPVDSPRNNNWYILTLATRRALTFLQKEPVVDPEKLGLFGFSMGGAITMMTAGIDPRVKAADSMAAAKVIPRAPDMKNRELWMQGVSAYAYARKVDCPMVFHNGSNDFHGQIDDVQRLSDILKKRNVDFRFTREPNKNHRSDHVNDVLYMLWFNEHLKGTFKTPKTPFTELKIDGGVPIYSVTLDQLERVEGVEIYYTVEDLSAPVDATKRSWLLADAKTIGDNVTALLPALQKKQKMRVFANVTYKLDKPVKAGWGYQADVFSISSNMDVTEF